ncbi:alkyl/aryl-sulfatase [Catenulispora pinisilvae]|uniref:alkyl/aryl-sulfatase n=1 Tax=Catenulispora pinisilvae TaxID=2705253 RepID=UPI0018918FDD|nr:alkyl sulfatase dimerization domain-containing protein [Catenulispora pinisilvae]
MNQLNYADRADFDNADRGFVAGPQQSKITTADGRVVWDFDSTKFLDQDCPDSVNPSLWRQSQLVARAGLYQVTEGVYQIRGFDLSNMTLIEGDTGVIVVDPLMSAETAAAGLALYRAQRGEKPVTGVIITHSHLDHFGGIHGVLDAGSDVPLIAPEHFMVESVAENVYAGTAMLRRGIYYAGSNLERGPHGLVSMGLGFTASTGNPGLLPPTVTITKTGQQESVDGVRVVFQVTPGTEAPSEMNFFLPDHRALCMAENATHNLHNILTLRGALVRDAHIWARYLGEAIALFADESDVLFASHHWPTWGTADIKTFLSQQRDLYAYLHDQTLRLLNQGYTGPEIAEMIELPPVLANAWHARDYYGSISHNVKAIYQRYMGWYDGNPVSLWEHPPTETAKRYAECFGGVGQIVAKARGYAEDGDLRFAAQLLRHAVFAEPDDTEAKNLLADVFEQLGRGAECATWRNCYLTGAAELRTGIKPTVILAGGMTTALSIPQFFDSLAIRVNGPKAWDARAVTDWHFTDLDEHYRLTLENGVLTYIPLGGKTPAEDAEAAFTLTKPQFMGLLAGKGMDGIQHTGDATVLTTVLGVLDDPDPDFAIVTP